MILETQLFWHLPRTIKLIVAALKMVEVFHPMEGKMHKSAVLLVVVLMILNLGAAPKGSVVTLTAKDVGSASDIEQAMIQATSGGTRPGTVVLDSSAGDFVYRDADRSINIFYSDVTLISLNGAVISNCADGVFFDSVNLDRVVIEGITFNCDGLGVSLWSQGFDMSSIMIHRNSFTTGTFGIEVVDVQEVDLAENTITSVWSGIRLQEVSSGRVISNSISTQAAIGILMSGASVGNQIHGNRVTCMNAGNCVSVMVPDQTYLASNNINGNPIR
jgi:hypothetical protein